MTATVTNCTCHGHLGWGNRDRIISICVLPIDIEGAKIDCLSLFMCPLLVQLKTGFFSSFSDAAVYSTNKQTRQALSSLYSVDVYGLTIQGGQGKHNTMSRVSTLQHYRANFHQCKYSSKRCLHCGRNFAKLACFTTAKYFFLFFSMH